MSTKLNFRASIPSGGGGGSSVLPSTWCSGSDKRDQGIKNHVVNLLRGFTIFLFCEYHKNHTGKIRNLEQNYWDGKSFDFLSVPFLYFKCTVHKVSIYLSHEALNGDWSFSYSTVQCAWLHETKLLPNSKKNVGTPYLAL